MPYANDARALPLFEMGKTKNCTAVAYNVSSPTFNCFEPLHATAVHGGMQ